ncbi:MAG: hypothetical protein L3K09_02135 [Thermoplasmata archaeon]|nr:hypothetical protein [Thermoplasmata archaeon]
MSANIAATSPAPARFHLGLLLRLAKGVIAWELLMALIAITIVVGALPLVIALLLHAPVFGWIGVPPAVYLFSQAQKLPMELLKEAASGKKGNASAS